MEMPGNDTKKTQQDFSAMGVLTLCFSVVATVSFGIWQHSIMGGVFMFCTLAVLQHRSN